MKQYRVSAVARKDLEAIWLYIAQDNVEAADRLIAAIISRFSKLATMPELGRKRDELSLRLRSFPVRNYIIFYRPIESGIEIARVLHGARDLPPLFD